MLLLAKRTSKRATSPACGLLIQGKAARSQPCLKQKQMKVHPTQDVASDFSG